MVFWHDDRQTIVIPIVFWHDDHQILGIPTRMNHPSHPWFPDQYVLTMLITTTKNNMTPREFDHHDEE